MDRRELEHYIWENRDRFYRLAYAYARNEAVAMDIVSAAIVKAFERHTGLRDAHALKTWFYRIVVNTALDSVRTRKRVVYLDDSPDPDPVAEDQYADSDLSTALEHLPAACRTVVILRYLEELQIEEIATVLKLNVNTVKSRLYRALELLRTDPALDRPISAGGDDHD